MPINKSIDQPYKIRSLRTKDLANPEHPDAVHQRSSQVYGIQYELYWCDPDEDLGFFPGYMAILSEPVPIGIGLEDQVAILNTRGRHDSPDVREIDAAAAEYFLIDHIKEHVDPQRHQKEMF